MEIIADKYYDHSKFANTRILLQMHLERFFANSVLREDGTRIFYASKGWAFRQRVNLLNENSNPQFSSLNFPFCAYYRNMNWTVGSEVAPGVPSAGTALIGTTDSGTPLKFFNAQFPFKAVFFFDREDDAQLAYETLMWLKLPSPNQTILSGLEYKGTLIDIPVRFRIDNILFNGDYKEKDWLERNRIIPIEVDCKLDSVIIKPQKQSPSSQMDPDVDEPIVITRSVLLDFLSFKKDFDLNQDGILYEIFGSFIPDPELDGVLTVTDVTQTSVTLTWDYNPLCEDLYDKDVIIECDNGFSVTVPKADKTATLSGLFAGSQYKIKIKFYAKTGAINKYMVTADTEPGEDGRIAGSSLAPAPLIGITWTN